MGIGKPAALPPKAKSVSKFDVIPPGGGGGGDGLGALDGADGLGALGGGDGSTRASAADDKPLSPPARANVLLPALPVTGGPTLTGDSLKAREAKLHCAASLASWSQHDVNEERLHSEGAVPALVQVGF